MSEDIDGDVSPPQLPALHEFGPGPAPILFSMQKIADKYGIKVPDLTSLAGRFFVGDISVTVPDVNAVARCIKELRHFFPAIADQIFGKAVEKAEVKAPQAPQVDGAAPVMSDTDAENIRRAYFEDHPEVAAAMDKWSADADRLIRSWQKDGASLFGARAGVFFTGTPKSAETAALYKEHVDKEPEPPKAVTGSGPGQVEMSVDWTEDLGQIRSGTLVVGKPRGAGLATDIHVVGGQTSGHVTGPAEPTPKVTRTWDDAMKHLRDLAIKEYRGLGEEGSDRDVVEHLVAEGAREMAVRRSQDEQYHRSISDARAEHFMGASEAQAFVDRKEAENELRYAITIAVCHGFELSDVVAMFEEERLRFQEAKWRWAAESEAKKNPKPRTLGVDEEWPDVKKAIDDAYHRSGGG